MKPSRVNRAVSLVRRAGKQTSPHGARDVQIVRNADGHPQGWPLLFVLTAPLSPSVRDYDIFHCYAG